MFKSTLGAIVLVIPLLLTGCAGVSFYSDSTLQTKTGIPIPAPKPYLLVARTEQKDNPIQVSIVYLPDYERVIYAKPRSGFGSAKLALSLTNGQLTSFGQETDTKIPELITSLAGLRTAMAGAQKPETPSEEGTQTLQGTKSSVEIGSIVSAVAKDIKSKIADKSLAGLNADQLKDVVKAQAALELAGSVLQNPAAAPLALSQHAIVKAQVQILEQVASKGADPSKEAKALNLIEGWVTQLKSAYEETDAKSASSQKATFELYEIIQSPAGSYLSPVTLKNLVGTATAP